MSMTRQTLLATRPAAMVLALSLVTAMTAPVLLLPRAQAQVTGAPVSYGCTSDGHTVAGGGSLPSAVGCTELSPTPPQDTIAVPPNIMLMLDDSGSMNWDYMPDACYLYGVTCTGTNNGTNPVNGNGVDYVQSANNNALIDSANNGVYYSPTQAYLPPPGPTGTLNTSYSDITNVPIDGFGTTTTNTANLTRYSNPDVSGEAEACGIPGNGNCGTSLIYSASRNVTTTSPATFDETVSYTRQYNWWQGGYVYTYADQVCRNDFNSQSGASNYSFTGLTRNSNGWLTGRCQYTYTATTTTTYRYFQYSTGPANGPYTIHYIAPASQGCGNLSATTTPTCILDTDTSGVAAPVGVTVGTNIANWFAYDHIRILMAKTGLMSAFANLNANYRFGFGSIDGNNDGALPNQISSNGFNIAPVAVFGDGTSGTQRANFWNWITGETASGGTPLQKALQAVGKYYQTAQPWTTMASDPGYSASASSSPFACRASYAIMTTDGFWNGGSPGVGNADNTSTGPFTVPTGDIAGYTPAAPYSDSYSNTLADVAMYYWANDLRTTLANEVAPSKQDPASWQHMTTFTMGLGFTPIGIQGTDAAGNPVTMQEIFNWAQGGAAITGFKWPQPASNSIYNIADLAHAAVNGHGDFFSIKSPQDLAAGFSKALADINARVVPPTPSSVNASVLTAGALTFETGYNTGDWSGSFKVVELNADGSAGASVWPTDPDTLLDTDFHGAGYTNRTVFTDSYQATNTAGDVTAFQFNAAALTASAPNTFDTTEYDPASPTSLVGLQSPGFAGGNDNVTNRINYLLGDDTYEGTAFRSRTSILGAVINAAPVYVSGAQSNYNGNWPANSPELPPATAPSTGGGVALQTYDDFVGQQSQNTGTTNYKPGMVYVAANDGMLHAFFASPPNCTMKSGTNTCTYAADSGTEAWAFIPRAVYANLGNLTSPSMSYRPTVDESPVSRDVFFGESGKSNTDDYWHTVLTGGVGLGGRGVYALDITNPDPKVADEPTRVDTAKDGNKVPAFSKSSVLWEFDSDMSVSTCTAVQNTASTGTTSDSEVSGGCSASDLGFTVSQPNIARLPNGTWVVLVPNGYFPDCSTPDVPTDPNLPASNPNSCAAIAAQAPQYNKGTATQSPYSALFVLDAQTGKVLYELKTPKSVPSFGLATPVLGDLTNNNVDNVAYAGDAEGNLWKFNLDASQCPNSAPMCVSLVYQAQTPGAQPITTMPRLFPDPVSNGFMVVFGTGKFLGVGDNNNNTVQAVYGVRDPSPASETGTPVSLANASGAYSLTQNYLQEETVPLTLPDGSANPSPQAGETLRCLTKTSGAACDSTTEAGTNDSSQTGGWYFNLDIQVSGAQADAGERVVVSPGAIFASNTIVVESLITGAASSDACSPTTTGALMAINGATGAPAGVSSLGGWPIIGGRINNARTSGNLPIVSALGGGQAFIPGSGLAPSGKTPFSVDAPIWRRRSWSEINEGQ